MSSEAPLALPGLALSKLSLTSIESTLTKSSFEEGKRAYAMGHYESAVKLFQHALNAVQSNIVSVILLHRAAAYEMMNKYDLALEDCRRANCDDRSRRPDAYLAHANTLVLQNKLSEANRMYLKGIKAVPKSHPKHSELVRMQEQLLNRIRASNQWIARRLPQELVYHILSYLPMKSRAQLAFTCQYWGSTVLREWPEMWSVVDLTTFGETDDIDRLLSFLEAINSEQLKAIKLGDMVSQALWMQVLKFIREKRRRSINLRSLEFARRTKEPSLPYILRNINRDALETLHISNSSTSEDLIKDLLDAARLCPNLQSVKGSLRGTMQERDFEPIPVSLESSALRLTHLQLSSSVRPMVLMRLFANAPHLLSISITRANYSEHAAVLGAVYEHCNQLQLLSYQDSNDDDGSGIKTGYTREDRGRLSSHCLKSLEVRIRQSICKGVGHVLGLMLQQNWHALEALLIDVLWLEERPFLKAFTEIGLPRLRTLEFALYNIRGFPYDDWPEDLHRALAACTSLERATLRGIYFYNPKVLNALEKLPVEQLTLHPGFLDVDYDPKAMYTMIPNASCLRCFTSEYEQCDSDHLVNLAAAISENPSITELNMISTRITNPLLVKIMEKLKHSRIRKLKLELRNPLGSKSFKALSNLPYLEELYVHYLNRRKVDEQTVNQILDACRTDRFVLVKLSNLRGIYILGSRAARN